jgi:hypothetical protein
MAPSAQTDNQPASAPQAPLPQISLPKGGGALRGINETFAADLATGTGSLQVPIRLSAGRAGSGPQLTLSYVIGALGGE